MNTTSIHQRILCQAEWQQAQENHRSRLEPWVAPHLQRHSVGEKHPAYDFLFTYYSFRPSHLMAWSPGFELGLEGDGSDAFLVMAGFHRDGEVVRQDASLFPASRRRGLQWVIDLLKASGTRAPVFGCNGLHEWAMVYRQPDVRHQQFPLRLAADKLADFVESQRVFCSHYDAFRFFTPAAKPLNELQPGSQDQHAFEQPGCLHVNMDLYKWAYKFYPWINSDLIADAFELAVEARELDMRASPYDLTSLGMESIPIETEAGRDAYRFGQQGIYEKAESVRQKLSTTLVALQTWVHDVQGAPVSTIT